MLILIESVDLLNQPIGSLTILSVIILTAIELLLKRYRARISLFTCLFIQNKAIIETTMTIFQHCFIQLHCSFELYWLSGFIESIKFNIK